MKYHQQSKSFEHVQNAFSPTRIRILLLINLLYWLVEQITEIEVLKWKKKQYDLFCSHQ